MYLLEPFKSHRLSMQFFGTPVHQLVDANFQSANLEAATKCVRAQSDMVKRFRYCSDQMLEWGRNVI